MVRSACRQACGASSWLMEAGSTWDGPGSGSAGKAPAVCSSLAPGAVMKHQGQEQLWGRKGVTWLTSPHHNRSWEKVSRGHGGTLPTASFPWFVQTFLIQRTTCPAHGGLGPPTINHQPRKCPTDRPTAQPEEGNS